MDGWVGGCFGGLLCVDFGLMERVGEAMEGLALVYD